MTSAYRTNRTKPKTARPASPSVGARLTIGARATLLLGLGMGAIAAVTVVPVAVSRTVSSP